MESNSSMDSNSSQKTEKTDLTTDENYEDIKTFDDDVPEL